MSKAVGDFGCLGCWRHKLVAVDGFRHVETAPAYVQYVLKYVFRCYEMLNTVLSVQVSANNITATVWCSQSHAFLFDKMGLAYRRNS